MKEQNGYDRVLYFDPAMHYNQPGAIVAIGGATS